MCGPGSLEFTEASPCNYKVLGVGFAYAECQSLHGGDPDGFKECLGGCVTSSDCPRACHGTRLGDPAVCEAKCEKMMYCSRSAITQSTGKVSFENLMRECIQQPVDDEAIAAAKRTYEAAMESFRPAPAPAPGPMPMVFSQLNKAPSSPAASKRSLVLVAETHKKQYPFAADPSCLCDTSGHVMAVQTNRPGCFRDTAEPAAGNEAYCYVQGGMNCAGAMQSNRFPGVWWTGCDLIEMQSIFTPECSLYGYDGPEVRPIPPLNISAPPPSALSLLPPTVSPYVTDINAPYQNWNTPLPNEWYARTGYVMGGAPPAMAPAPAMPPVAQAAGGPALPPQGLQALQREATGKTSHRLRAGKLSATSE